MKRFDFDDDDAAEDVTGEWIRYRDHRAEADRMQAKYDELKRQHDELMDRFAKYLGGA
jgi:hypothetical protein